MTDWRDRVLKALYVPANQAEEFEMLELPLKQLWEKAGIDWFCSVRGTSGQENNFVMVVDDAGHDKQFAWNPRAQYLSQYPVEHGIVGGALFFSEAMIDDGMDLVNLSTKGHDWLTAESRKHSYLDWRMANKWLFARHGYLVE